MPTHPLRSSPVAPPCALTQTRASVAGAMTRTWRLLAAALVAALLGQAAATAPSGANCPASYLSYNASALCCPAGFALTELNGNACQTFTCAAGNNATQCAVLGDWYYATKGPQWTPSGSSFSFADYVPNVPNALYTTANFQAWAAAASGTATDFSTFAEIGVDTNGNVIGIYFNPNHNGYFAPPQGSFLPPSLGLLTTLLFVDISGAGNFVGSIPSSYSALTSLKYFLAQSSFMTPNSGMGGTIPPGFCQIASKCYIDQYANLSLPPPSTFSKVLGQYTLNCCAGQWSPQGYTGQLPALVGNLSLSTTLSYVDMSSWSLSGSIPSLSRSSASLTYLDLHTNSLSGTIPTWLGTATALTYLDLSNNNLNGMVPPWLIARCSTQGVTCALGGNQFTSLNLSATMLSTPVNATSISIAGNPWGLQYGTTVLPNLSAYTALTSLVINNLGSALTGTVPDMFASMKALTNLDLSGNILNGTLPLSLFVLCSNASVTCNVGNNPSLSFSLSILALLPPSTTSICIDQNGPCPWWPGTQMGGTIPNLSALTALTTLQLNTVASLSAPLPDMFANMTALKTLYLQGNLLNGTIPASIGSLTALTTMCAPPSSCRDLHSATSFHACS